MFNVAMNCSLSSIKKKKKRLLKQKLTPNGTLGINGISGFSIPCMKMSNIIKKTNLWGKFKTKKCSRYPTKICLVTFRASKK